MNWLEIPRTIPKSQKAQFIKKVYMIIKVIKRYKCILQQEDCTARVDAVPLYFSPITLCDIRNYLPVCSKHRYKIYPKFNPYNFVEQHAPEVYETLRYLHNNDIPFAEAIKWETLPINIYLVDSVTSYLNSLYDIEWVLSQKHQKMKEKKNE